MTHIPSGLSQGHDQDDTFALTIKELLARLNDRENFALIVIPGENLEIVLTARNQAALNTLMALSEAGVFDSLTLDKLKQEFGGMEA